MYVEDLSKVYYFHKNLVIDIKRAARGAANILRGLANIVLRFLFKVLLSTPCYSRTIACYCWLSMKQFISKNFKVGIRITPNTIYTESMTRSSFIIQCDIYFATLKHLLSEPKDSCTTFNMATTASLSGQITIYEYYCVEHNVPKNSKEGDEYKNCEFDP